MDVEDGGDESVVNWVDERVAGVRCIIVVVKVVDT